MKTLRFLAKAGDHSYSPPAVRGGRTQPLGKTRNDDGSWSVNTDPTEVTIGGDEEVADTTFLRGEVLEGRLIAADQDTADAIGTPFDVVAVTPPPAPAPAGTEARELAPTPGADAKHSDTLPPPALDAPIELPTPPKTALTKRLEK